MIDYPEGIQYAIKTQCEMPKKILWISASAYPDIGGAEWSLRSNSCLLKDDFGQIILSNSKYENRVVDSIPILECKNDIENIFYKTCQWYKPDYIATQGPYSKTIIEISIKMSLKVIYFLRAKSNLNFNKYLAYSNFKVVANSEWMVDWFEDRYIHKPMLLYPIVIPWMVTAKKTLNQRKKYITHVGDIQVKGGDRVYEIALQMHRHKFLVTKSWPFLRKESGVWDQNKIDLLNKTDGSTTVFEENITNFSELENVDYITPMLEQGVLYSSTKIMLFASRWKEPYGRVITESILNGVPVVVSPEAYHPRWKGLVYKIDNGDNIMEWIAIVNYILNEGIDKTIKKNIELFQQYYSVEKDKQALLDIFVK